jgi:hypothetical protein
MDNYAQNRDFEVNFRSKEIFPPIFCFSPVLNPNPQDKFIRCLHVKGKRPFIFHPTDENFKADKPCAGVIYRNFLPPTCGFGFGDWSK